MNVVLERIKERFIKNQNWLCVIIGETGSGKSWSAIKIAEVLDPEFSINNICFTPKEFLERIDSGELKKGSMLVYDEAGITFGARDFYQDINKALSYVLQGFRAFNLGTIFTTPNISFIDIHARKLIHSVIETTSVNHNEGFVWVKWKNLEHNPLYDKTYYKFPRLIKAGRIKTETKTKIWKASDKLLEEYEKKKMSYLKALTKKSLDDVNRVERRRNPISDEELLKIKDVNWKNVYDIMAKCKVSQQRAYRLMKIHTHNNISD